MSERGDAAQNGGSPAGPKKEGRKRRQPDRAAKDGARGAAKTIKEGRRNEKIYMERLAGRSARALAAEYDLSARQIHDICKACHEAGITELELNAPWRSQRFAEEYLLEIEEATNNLRELELGARAQNNYSAALGALKQRVKLLSERTKFLQATGLMSGPRNLKFDAELGQFWGTLNQVAHDHNISDAGWVALSRAMSSAPGAGPFASPARWLPSNEELEAARRREREAAEREAAEADLLREGARRREAEQEQVQLQWREEARQRQAQQREEARERAERISRENKEAPRREAKRRAEATEAPAERPKDPGPMTHEDMQRMLGTEAPLESHDPWEEP
jgi:hypothetical protein